MNQKIKIMSFLLNCPQTMISNLNNIYENFPLILKSSNEEIIQKQLMNINSMIINNIDYVLRFFNFEFSNYEGNLLYRDLIKFYIKNESLSNIVKKCLVKLIKNEEDFLITLFH